MNFVNTNTNKKLETTQIYGILINTVNHFETKANFNIINNNILNVCVSKRIWKRHKINCGVIDFGNLNYLIIN